MNILFINPPNVPYTDKNILIESIDTLQLATYVRTLNHSVSFLDMDCKKLGIEELKYYVKNTFMPDIAVIAYDYHIPLHTNSALKTIGNLINELKRYNINTIFIGKLVTFCPKIINKLNFDIGILGEPEIPLKQILDNTNLNKIKGIVYIDNKKIHINNKSNEKIDIDTLPMADRNLVDIEEYIDVRSILTSRGCINKCAFCPTHKYWGQWRGRSAKSIVEEIEFLVKEYNTKKIMFLDDNSTVDKKRMQEVCKTLIDKKIKIKMGCLASINTYDKETFILMYEAGFRWVHFGIESGSQKVLNNNNKFFDICYARQVIKEVKKMGYRVRTSFIFDLPTTTREDMHQTIKFIIETQPHEIRGHFLRMRLGTKVYEEHSESDEIPNQYIHGNQPMFYNKKYKISEMLEDIKCLEKELEKNDYKIIRQMDEWDNIEKLRNKNDEIKFLSFCPAKYGIDWT